MTLNVYIASITANTEVRKQVQKVLMVLDGMGVPFNAIDITLRGNEKYRDFMRENAINERCDGVPLPPQFFDDDEYLGNYMDFEEAVEENQLTEFLRLIPSRTVKADGSNDSNENEDEEDDEEDEEEGENDDEEEGEGTSEGNESESTSEEDDTSEGSREYGEWGEDEGEEDEEEGFTEEETDEQEVDDDVESRSTADLGSSSKKDDARTNLENGKEIEQDKENSETNKEEKKEEGDEEGNEDDVELEDEDFEDEDEEPQ